MFRPPSTYASHGPSVLCSSSPPSSIPHFTAANALPSCSAEGSHGMDHGPATAGAAAPLSFGGVDDSMEFTGLEFGDGRLGEGGGRGRLELEDEYEEDGCMDDERCMDDEMMDDVS
ncbi:hypothetical protein TrRE_jg1292, partial [Triparma retinervis]